jgi:hypothetical protein
MAAVGVLLGLKVLCDRHRWTDLVLVYSREGGTNVMEIASRG